MAKEILCGFGVDVDAVAGWLGSYGGEDSPDDISRGLFAGEVGSPRLLKLFERMDIKTTWFIPGHSIETFPAQMKAVADAGHEIGIHGYSHENPIAMTPTQEEDVLVKSIELIKGLTGKAPRGYVAPWWEMSNSTAALLLKHGLGALGVHAISKPKQLAGATVYRVLMPNDKEMWLCFDPYTEALKADIVEAAPAQVVMLNSCFVGRKADELLSNLQLELAGLEIGLTVI